MEDSLMDVQMLVVQGKQRGQTIRFRQGEFVFGRGPECHVRPNSEWVSLQHCLLRVGADSVHIRDLGSTNGTLINGVRVIGERRLDPGDHVQIGPLVLQILFDAPDTDEFRAMDTDADMDMRQAFTKEPVPEPAPKVPVQS
jgi:pSer/pThr/pTyr-binding forkhead associated (FHA) protein